MSKMLYRIGNLCGVLAPVLWAAVIIFSGFLRPEYHHYSQYISELGERGSSTELIMRYGAFVPTGMMHIVFSGFLFNAFKENQRAKYAALLIALNGIARIGAGMFPCEVGCALPRLLLSQKLHSLSAGVGFFAMIASVCLWGFVFKGYNSLRSLSTYSIFSGCMALLFLVLMTLSAELRTGTGLYERLATGLLSLWMMVFAVRLWRLIETYET